MRLDGDNLKWDTLISYLKLENGNGEVDNVYVIDISNVVKVVKNAQ